MLRPEATAPYDLPRCPRSTRLLANLCWQELQEYAPVRAEKASEARVWEKLKRLPKTRLPKPGDKITLQTRHAGITIRVRRCAMLVMKPPVFGCRRIILEYCPEIRYLVFDGAVPWSLEHVALSRGAANRLC
jgi:hypothetical protein